MIIPMVARLVRDPFDREGWLFELKLCLGDPAWPLKREAES